MTSPQFRVVPLTQGHDKTARGRFDSESPALNNYFQTRVTQDIRNNVAKCYVALHDDRIVGFYTLASTSLNLKELPPEHQKRLPRYPRVPAVLMGRLAIDREFKDIGLGRALVADALTKTIESTAGNFALVVDAKDEDAKDFYLHLDFIQLGSRPDTLFLPLADAVASRP